MAFQVIDNRVNPSLHIRKVIHSIDNLIYTYYSAALPSKASGVAYSIYTKQIFLPRPENAEEKRIADEVELATKESGAIVKYYGANGKITVGDAKISCKFRVLYGEGTAMSILSIESLGQNITYLSSGTLADKEAMSCAFFEIENSDCVIFGSGGKKYKDRVVFARKYERIKKIVLSGKNLIFTQSSLMYYDEKEAEIYLRPKKVVLSP